MHSLRLRTYVLFLVAGCALGLTVMLMLPHDKFLRYQGLNDGLSPTAYWVYERIHMDPTPIDVAFIGTSRIGLSIHSRRLEEDLQRLGIAAKAANLHIVKTGTNMQYVIAKELLETRKVKLLVVEMTETEDRKTHPDFIYLADTFDVVSAPMLMNVNYFSDLVRLPGRQIDLFLQTQGQRFGWNPPSYVPSYEGSNLDHAEFIRTLDGVRHERRETYTSAEMENLRNQQDMLITPRLLPISMDDFEFRLPRHYMHRILELARSHNTGVVFLYTPRYGGPPTPAPYERYANHADLINPSVEVKDYRLWSDAVHLNWDGAKRMTDYVANVLATRKELR